MTTREAAAALGIRPVSVRRAIYAGRLEARQGHWPDESRLFITARSVEKYRETYLGRPGPKKGAKRERKAP